MLDPKLDSEEELDLKEVSTFLIIIVAIFVLGHLLWPRIEIDTQTRNIGSKEIQNCTDDGGTFTAFSQYQEGIKVTCTIPSREITY